jgi:hypothetical protein
MRLCIGVKLQGLHRAPPPLSHSRGALMRGGGGPARSGMEPGKAMCDYSWLFTSLERSLVKLPIVGMEPRVRTMINHVGVTNIVRQR